MSHLPPQPIRQMMKQNEDWPLSLDELRDLSKPLSMTISFEAIANKHCKGIESVSSALFTHRCICPNPYHKGGSERKPSFYFSDKDKFYKCFSCNVSGDIFDFITLTEGIPWHDVVSKLIDSGDSTLESLQLEASGKNSIELANYVFDLNMDISNSIRAYLLSIKSSAAYTSECKWANGVFKRVDETFAHFADIDLEQAKAFHSQIIMELSRRKLSNKEDIREAV